MSNHDMTLVIGGTGKTGRRVAQRLQARGLATRIGSRSAEPAFDWDDHATWEPALRGATAVYVSYYPDLAVPGAPAAVGALAELAADCGVQRLVLLSGRGEEEAQASERKVRSAFPGCTIVRCAWFNQNFSESFFLEPVLAGTVALPAGDVPEPFVDAEDVADVAVAALTGDGHAGELYELTGPRLLRFEEAVDEIAAASGRALAFVPVALAEYRAEMAEHGVPDDVAALVTYLFGEVLDGRNAQLADGVQRALGRAPRDFGEYARATAASGAWAG
jgi:uncharacterized protein YbjT (DUF2867 family)